MIRLRHLAIAAFASVAACTMPSMEASPERDRDAQLLLEDIAADRDDALMAKMASQNDPAQIRAQLPFLKTLVPEGAPPQGVTRGWRANMGTGGTTYALTRSYEYPDRTLNVDTTFIKEGETWKVLGFHLSPTMKPVPAAATAGPDAPAEEKSPHSD